MSTFAIYNTPIGSVRIAYKDRKVVELRIIADDAPTSGERNECLDRAYTQLMEYLRGERTQFTIDLDIEACTPFQQRVYSELLRIPYGETRTYKEIATAIGNSNASRAVGSANNRNPIAILIPCHRVVGSGGRVVGYAYGVERKERLLGMESSEKSRY